MRIDIKEFRDLLTEMHLFVRQHDLGEVLGSRYTVVLGNHRFEPDIVFISINNPGKFTELEFIGTPDLVVEILSKTTRDYDLNTKRRIYQQHRIPEIVFIDLPQQHVVIDFLEAGKYRTRRSSRKKIISKVPRGFEFGGYWSP